MYTYLIIYIGRDGGLSTLCQSCDSCRFHYQQRVLKTFAGPGYLHPEDGAVCLWHLLLRLNPFDLSLDREGWWSEHSFVIVVDLIISRGC